VQHLAGHADPRTTRLYDSPAEKVTVPCHHNLERLLDEYITGRARSSGWKGFRKRLPRRRLGL